ncbi:MAG: CheR family methyltransferase [Marinilabiliaceae bacterium]
MARYEGMNYTGYNFSFLKRRLGHVFAELKVRRLPQFIERLSDESFRDLVRYHMAVNVTEMFRDPGFWRSLRIQVLPHFRSRDWRVWFPDATSGEEVFSLAIILKEDGLLDQAEIVCHHPSSEKCREISEGVFYHKNEETNLNNYRRLEENDQFEDYFIRTNGQVKFRDDLLHKARFFPEWFTDLGEDEKFDLIIFRNSAINFTFQRRDEVLQKVVEHLQPGGFLAIGVKEPLPVALRNILIPVDEKESIYKLPDSQKR